jgi:hypothetical protein
MHQKVTSISPRLFAESPCRARADSRQPSTCWDLPTLQHPALSHPAEADPIHHSLDLSFRQAVAVSHLDRELIDNLTRPRPVLLQRF